MSLLPYLAQRGANVVEELGGIGTTAAEGTFIVAPMSEAGMQLLGPLTAGVPA